MKNRFKAMAMLALAFAVLTLASCSTYVRFTVAEPSEVSLGAYRSVAVASADYSYSLIDLGYLGAAGELNVKDKADSGTYLANFPKYKEMYRLEIGADTAQYAGEVIAEALDQGYYTIAGPTVTDALITVGKAMGSIQKQFLENGIEVLVKSSISSLKHEEYLEIRANSAKAVTESQAHKVYDAYYVRKAEITLSYQVIDIANNTMITADEIRRSSVSELLVGRVDPKVDGGKFKQYVDELPQFSDMFLGLVDQCYAEIRDTLTPHYSSFSVALAKDKTKDESLKTAYELADDGYLKDAYVQFNANWERTSNTAAGYNAALLLGAMGQYEEGAALARTVYERSGYVPALEVEASLLRYKELGDQVSEQLSAAEPSASTGGDLIGF